jgi:hypothetical protein
MNYSPSCVLGKAIENLISIKNENVMENMERQYLSSLEDIFNIPHEFRNNGAVYTTAGQSFLMMGIMAKQRMLKAMDNSVSVDKMVSYTTKMSNIAVERSLAFANFGVL